MDEKININHIAFIMDGNGRWATSKNKSRNYGHVVGANNVDNIVSSCFEKGIKVVSLFAFSCENWQRPKLEVDKILFLLSNFLKKRIKKLIKQEVRLIFSGDLSPLPKNLRDLCIEKMRLTQNFNHRIINIALNYGGRQEIIKAVNEILLEGKIEIDDEEFNKHLYTHDLPDIDLVIRTSGEQRLSNFFLYQCAYSELYFTDVCWPNFNEIELDKAIDWFNKRKRRFGKI